MHEDVHEDEALYLGLMVECARVCKIIVDDPPSPTAGPSVRRIHDVACRYLSAGPVRDAPVDPQPGASAGFDALSKLAADWPRLRRGEVSGEAAFAKVPGLWEQLMCEPPMGSYARLAAAHVNPMLQTRQTLVELGAGLGNASRLLQVPSGLRYIRTDINPILLHKGNLPGTPQRYNFDHPSNIRDADIVFAVNALHCAKDPARTLLHVWEMLREGGLVLLAEGAPHPSPNRPWALDVLFCQFEGWWDRGGFRNREQWIADLQRVGFHSIEHQRLVAGENDLGGLISARR